MGIANPLYYTPLYTMIQTETDDVVKQTLQNAQKGKDISVHSSYVRRMQLFSKIYPHRLVMKMWVKSIKKYIN